MFLKRWAMFILFIVMSCCIYSQAVNDTIRKKGVIVHNRSFSRHFVVLMQDSSLSGNRFDNRFDSPAEINQSINPQRPVLLPVFIIDSSILLKSEEKLLSHDTSVTFYNYSKDKLQKRLKRYIHLYIGYIDSTGTLKVVVQFVTPDEYINNERILSSMLWLLAQQKNLRFAILKYRKNEY